MKAKPHSIKWHGFECQAKGAHNHKCTHRKTYKYANTNSHIGSANKYANAKASFPSLRGQEEHSRHIISECFSSQCDNMSAWVPVTTPLRIDIHQLCSSLGRNTTMTKIWHWKKIFPAFTCLYIPPCAHIVTYMQVSACTPILPNVRKKQATLHTKAVA